MAVGLDLDQYQMRKRVLLVFAPTPRDARWEDQSAYLDEGTEDLDDRKVTVFGIFEDGPSFAEDRPVSREDSERAREEFGVPEGAFALRLIDLDGTEILESSEPLPAAEIVDVVDEKRDRGA